MTKKKDRSSTGSVGASRSPLGRVWSVLTQRFTIMLIPHSERSVLNFHVSILAIVFVGGLLLAAIGGFVYLSSIHIGSGAIIDSQQAELEQNRANLDATISEIRTALRVARSFDEELANTLNSLGIDGPDPAGGSGISRGDLADFFDLQVVAEDRAREIQDLRDLTSSLGESVEPLREIRRVLQSREALLADIPNLWPVANGHGRVTMEFGPNIHPITGQWYLHKGIDIAGVPGVPIVAAANGRVVEIGYDQGYGLYVVLRHKYGFRTRYSHLQSVLVTEGQDLVQGERLGLLGNTGVSTGPHLDFIVQIGTDVVDPAAFLKISNQFARGGTGTR